MQTLRVTSKKYFNSLTNGTLFNTDLTKFDTNLVSLIGEYVKAEFILEISWESTASITDSWIVTERATNEYEISRALGSFRSDGWSVGNIGTLQVDERVSSPPASSILPVDVTIDFISDDGSFMFVTCTSDLTTESPYEAHRLRPKASLTQNHLNAIVYKPNLIENDAQYTNVSLQNDVPIEWYATGIRSTTPVQMSPRGVNESFDSGDVEINYEGDIGTYFQTFKISHSFVVHPYFTEEFGLDLPPYLDGTSLKYVFKADFRNILSNTGTSKVFAYENSEGVVGYFGETANKTISPLSVTCNSHLSVTSSTTAQIVVSGANFDPFNTDWKYQLIFTKLPTRQEYSSNNTFYDTFDYFFDAQSAGASSSFPSRIEQMSSTINGDLTINVTFSAFSTYTANDEYALFLLIGDAEDFRNRTILLIDRNNFLEEISNNGLIELTANYTNYHGDVGVTEAHIEDGLAVNFNFNLDLNKQAFIKKLKASLVAYNDSSKDFFYLDEYEFNLPIQTVNGVQILDYTETRGYPIPSTMFNIASIATSTNTGNIQNYIGTIGQKITWQDWVSNPRVADVFFDVSEPNDNKNLKASNYSLKEGYQIRMLFEATVNGLDESGTLRDQNYIFLGNPIEIFNYGEDGDNPPKVTATIETFDTDGNNLDGNLLQDTDVLFRITWDGVDEITSTTGVTVTHRIEAFEQRGFQIFELSSNKDDYIASSPLFADNNRVQVRLENGNIISECFVKVSKLTGEDYSLSGKITKI